MPFEVRRLEPLGVEIVGLDPVRPMPDGDLAALRRTVVEEGLAVLRSGGLPPEVHAALGRRLGEIERGAFNPDSPHPDVILLTNVGSDGRMLPTDDVNLRLVSINEGWHTDSAFRPIPASFSLLSAVVVPQEGGDTSFASLRRGWEALEPGERESLYGLRGVHDYAEAWRRRGAARDDDPAFDLPCAIHPLVRRHPESGAVSLYLSEHLTRIEGWTEAASQPLIDRLLEVTTAPERVYRHRWTPGDLLVWDNRSMIHQAQGFPRHHPRVMHHVRIVGEEPIAAEAAASVSGASKRTA